VSADDEKKFFPLIVTTGSSVDRETADGWRWVTCGEEVKMKSDPLFVAKSTEEAWCTESFVRNDWSDATLEVEMRDREGDRGVLHVTCVESTTVAVVKTARA
jgi:hypothetical protein